MIHTRFIFFWLFVLFFSLQPVKSGDAEESNMSLNLRQFCYCSASTVRNTPTEVIDELVQNARSNNKKYGITGILLFRDDSYFQCIEGEENVLQELIYNITKDTRHKLMTVLYNIEISQRDFSYWSLGFRIPSNLFRSTGKHFDDFPNYLDDPKGFQHPLSKKIQSILQTFEKIM